LNYIITIKWEGIKTPLTSHNIIEYKNKTFFFEVNNSTIFKKKMSIPILEKEENNTLFRINKIDINRYELESIGIFSDPYFDIEQKVLEKFNNYAFKAGMRKLELSQLTSSPSCFMYKYIDGNIVDLIYMSIPLIDDLYNFDMESPIPLVEIEKK